MLLPPPRVWLWPAREFWARSDSAWRWVGARRTEPARAGGLIHQHAAAVGFDSAPPVAPVTALGAGMEVGRDYWLRADPIRLHADLTCVRLIGWGALLDGDPHPDTLQVIREFFSAFGVPCHFPDPRTGLLRLRTAPSLQCRSPDDFLGADIGEGLPQGADAPDWRRRLTELEMTLHLEAPDDPVGINGVWLWGGGELNLELSPTGGVRAETLDFYLRGLTRLHRVRGETRPAVIEDAAQVRDIEMIQKRLETVARRGGEIALDVRSCGRWSLANSGRWWRRPLGARAVRRWLPEPAPA